MQPVSEMPKFCKLCFHAISSSHVELADGQASSVPDSPLSRIRNSRVAHLAELSSFSSPRSSRSDEEEDGNDSGKNFFSPPSEQVSQDVSDVDSVSISTGLELHSFKSVYSSLLDSPSIGGETTGDNSPLDREAPSYFRKAGAETEDLLEGSHDSGYDRLSVYRNHASQKVQNLLDFENNKHIWDPPLPEDENDDMETGFFGYDDEDENAGDCDNVFSSGSFSNRSLGIRERPSDAHKEQLRNAVHGHFRALVCQLLRGEGLQVGSEDGNKGWLDIVSLLAWEAATFVKPDTSKGSSMDPGNYVKVKCILSGSPSDSILVKGVVCTKNIKHKRMVSQHKNPRLFLLGGALEYQRVTNKLASLNTVLEQETDHLKVSLSKIEAHRPNVLLVEKSVSSYAQEYLLTKEISLVLNVKRKLLERIAQCTGSHIAPSIDNIAPARLGYCDNFRVEKFYEECSSTSHPNRKFMKTLMFFEGCPRRLGCTVLLRGTNREELKKVKHVVQYASFAAYHLSRETSFLADEGATLPKVPVSPQMILTTKILDAETRSLKNSTSIVPEARQISSCTSDAVSCFLQCSDVPSPRGDISTSDSFQLKRETCEPLDFPTDLGDPKEVITSTIAKGRNSELYKELMSDNEGMIKGAYIENEAADYFSSADSQSILVSLSTTCVLKDTVSEPSQLLRIKFYGSSDKPLGTFLRDDLFDQTSCCQSCKEPAEAHVRCYTHQHGSLTISVRRHPSIKLPGERDGRIWMWHRCLKCENSNGVPPAACRVVMSDAAWSLSFGKFLELSFSNHATANRVASCGHSLQKDCLRFYGCGSMVAFLRYSPVNILSVQLPPLVLDFACQSQQELAKREAVSIASKIELLHAEVKDVLHTFEKKNTTSKCEAVKTSIHKYIMELKDLLERERNEYDVFLQPSPMDDSSPSLETIDILELNRLRRFLLIDSHMWDRRLCLLDSFSKSKTSTSKLNPLEWRTEPIDIDENFKKFSEGSISKPRNLSKLQEELDLCLLECHSNNSVETDWSIESVEGYNGPAYSFVSDHYCRGDDDMQTTNENCPEITSLQRLPSAASTLSDKIDSLWSGNPDSDAIGSITLLDNPLYRKAISPLRVNSFDSALRSQDRIRRGPSASLHLTSVRSFDASGDFASTNISQRSPRSKRVNFLPGDAPVFISSIYNMVGEGARLLLPQTGRDDLVIVLYDNEPTTIISYAISSQDHADFLTSDHQVSHESSARPSISQFQSDEATHFRISFDDDSSIPNDRVKFSVTCYFAKQFAALRKKCCPNEADFLRSLSRCKRWNARGGKSNVYFAKSLDERFIIKQVTKTELDSFEVFAAEYFKYMTESINSGSPTCLAKVLGIYQVTVRHLKGGREVKMDMMVMENLFFGRSLSKVYDLKGSLRARYNPDTSGNDSVLLDLNLLESVRTKPIFLGSKAKRRLERAIWNDTSFLAESSIS
ncbi:putative 1-phosphatidylinositol-3-phosphate 5-kinase FAB1C isoform X2 [Asparagus officinalis]|uniref:putative 1-phosphatidylinositol-3-phosphate 5-kinase FAB1C isoform X2 n=1 Tax=Asparagus officinalis TaxID=4686 RepID=UPI00098E8419|nr:putative 1-phosphatidylinositol-3-phosphate 5-kinase FAB1C isoform X2 [Asparagus officinalis]